MAVKLNKDGKYYVYGKYKNFSGNYESYFKQTTFTSKKKAQEFDKNYKKELESNLIHKSEAKLFDIIDLLIGSKDYSQSSLTHFQTLKNSIENVYIDVLNVQYINKITRNLTISNIKTLKLILNFAYKYDYIDKKLADFIIPKKKKEKEEISIFDESSLIENAHTFSNGIELNDIIIFLLDTGLRINECLSLTFDRIFENHIVIDRQMIYNKTKKEWEWQKLKSKASYRKVPLTNRVKEIIKKQIYIKNGFLFGGVSFMIPNNVQKHIKKSYNTHPHALRHTCASRLIVYSYEVLGYCDKDNIAKFMGHDEKELNRTYKHLFKDKNDELVKVLEYIYEKKGN